MVAADPRIADPAEGQMVVGQVHYAVVDRPAAEVDAAVKSAYKEIAKKYNFQGFRRGHAPRPVIDGIVGRESVLAQATNDLLNAAEPLMLEELDVTPVGRVSFGAEDADPELVVEGTDYVVTAVIGVRPSCELESYDAPKINMPPEEATEAEIDWQINQLLSYRGRDRLADQPAPQLPGHL